MKTNLDIPNFQKITDNPKYCLGNGFYSYLEALNKLIVQCRREGFNPTKLYLGKNLVKNFKSLNYIGAPPVYSPQDVVNNLGLKLEVVVTENKDEFSLS